mmetsp:Transcript_91375/g.295559  ORF Transcript_91375/g.295559 Transcript_91375/m.295559 type:complete len:335 (+) Transcript_91375:1154-2158(+)
MPRRHHRPLAVPLLPRAVHGVGLPCPRLAVGEDRRVVSVHGTLHEVAHAVEDFFLRSRAPAGIEGKGPAEVLLCDLHGEEVTAVDCLFLTGFKLVGGKRPHAAVNAHRALSVLHRAGDPHALLLRCGDLKLGQASLASCHDRRHKPPLRSGQRHQKRSIDIDRLCFGQCGQQFLPSRLPLQALLQDFLVSYKAFLRPTTAAHLVDELSKLGGCSGLFVGRGLLFHGRHKLPQRFLELFLHLLKHLLCGQYCLCMLQVGGIELCNPAHIDGGANGRAVPGVHGLFQGPRDERCQVQLRFVRPEQACLNPRSACLIHGSPQLVDVACLLELCMHLL